MSNAYEDLLSTLPQAPLQVGTVETSADGVCTVELPGGGKIRARGAATVGQTVFVRDGVIEATAPTLTLVLIEI